jgi:hypothetical protein
MMLEIHLRLIRDATFGRGDGVAGLVDEEVEHDAITGLPFLRGRTLKGLLVEECANTLFALSRQASPALSHLQEAAKFLFGGPGSTLDDEALMHVGPALLPSELWEAVDADIRAGRLTPAMVLESLTAIRRQTAVDEGTGAPEEGSLRAMRVVLRETPLVATMRFDEPPDSSALGLLAACVLSLRRGGMGRNRGRGLMTARLYDPTKPADRSDVTDAHFQSFKVLVRGKESAA